MKKSTMLAFTAAVLMSAASLTGHAASAPTYDDTLIVKNPVMTPQLGSVVLVPVASPQTVAAVHDYVKAWQNAEINIAKAKYKRDNYQELSKADMKWLHSYDKHDYAEYFRTYSVGRVHGQEVFLNWNGENRNKNQYEYFNMPKYNDQDGFTNSYGYNVLRGMVDQINAVIQEQKKIGGPITDEEAQALEDAILDIMAHDQEHVNNDELRHYMNDVIWFAAKQTVKNKGVEEPCCDGEHEVDLRAALAQLPEEQPESRKANLRDAIGR